MLRGVDTLSPCPHAEHIPFSAHGGGVGGAEVRVSFPLPAPRAKASVSQLPEDRYPQWTFGTSQDVDNAVGTAS